MNKNIQKQKNLLKFYYVCKHIYKNKNVMKKPLLIIALFIITQSIFSQSYEWGGGVEMIEYNSERWGRATGMSPDTTINGVEYRHTNSTHGTAGLLSAFGGLNYNIFSISDDISIEVNPMFQIGVSPDAYVTHIPLNVLCRFGASMDNNSDSRLGIGLGATYKFSYYVIEDGGLFTSTPSLLGEISIVRGDGNIVRLFTSYDLNKEVEKQFEFDPDRVYNGYIKLQRYWGVYFSLVMPF